MKMGNHGVEHINTSRNDAVECSGTTIEIMIKTLDSQTFTLRVDKCISVPELKEKAALLTGIQSDRQRLIFQGKLLRDDQLLSAYKVEDGHTLHLVVRQPFAPSPESLSERRATDMTPSTPHNPGNQVRPSMLISTYSVSEPGNRASHSLTEIVSAVRNSSGATTSESGGTGIDLNQPPPEQMSTAPGLSGRRISTSLSSDQEASTDEPVESQQPLVMPYSLNNLPQLLSHLRRQSLADNAGGQNEDSRNTGQGERNGRDSEAASGSSESRRPLWLDFLADLSAYTAHLLEETSESFLDLVAQLDQHASLTDATERSIVETNATRSIPVFQRLGALLVDFGRAITAAQAAPVQGASPGTFEHGGSVEISITRAVLTRRRVRTIGSQTQGAEENAPPVLSDDSSAGGVGLRLVDSNSENTTTTTSSTNPVTAAQLGANSVQTQDGDEKADDEGSRPQPSNSKRQRWE